MAQNSTQVKNKKKKKIEKEIVSPLRKAGQRLRLVNSKIQIWIFLILLSVVISLLLFPNILVISEEGYFLGDVAKKDIKASRDFLVEDKELTRQRRAEAVKSSFFVYDFDRKGEDITQRIKDSFDYARKELGPILFAKSVPDNEPSVDLEKEQLGKKTGQVRDKFFEILGIAKDEPLFGHLVDHEFSRQIEEDILLVINEILKKGVVGNKTVLMSQKGKGIILRDMDTKDEIRVNDLGQFYELEETEKRIHEIVKERLGKDVGPELVLITESLAKKCIRPNITLNKRETELRKTEAEESVKPIYFKVKKGEMIVREGEKINPVHILKLETGAKLKRNTFLGGMVIGMTVIIGILLALNYVIFFRGLNSFKTDPRNLIFFAMILFVMYLVVILHNVVSEEVARGIHYFNLHVLLFAMPIALGAILVSVFQGLEVAIAFSLIISVLASFVTGGRVEFFVYYLIGSLLAAYEVRHCRERMVFIKTGIKIGLLNIVMALSVQALHGDFSSLLNLLSVVSAFLGGILAGVVATGILPLIEMIFGFTTDIKLLELSSLDQPVLKELMVTAPGTYHHSVVVSSMVEATAEDINANPLLAKVSAYYHDIGKIRKPLYFVENQTRGENRHGKLAPSMSSLILISHVKDGVELAKKSRLGREIIDIIQQHHGTSLISYFYQKAKEQKGKKAGKSAHTKEEDFRYPGPKPQTKEAGLVMVADAVEAASRTLVDPTPARIKGMVQKIINNIFSDGQLDECELTLKDLNLIARSFTKTLSGIFHGRVEYPAPVEKGGEGKKGENGDSNKLQPLQARNKSKEDKEKPDTDLKRLGMP